MTRTRTTIDRALLIDHANKQLRADSVAFPKLDQAYRQGLIAFVSSVLHDSGTYKGFNYLSRKMLDNGTETPGIQTIENGSFEYLPNNEKDRFYNTDSTRVYFI